MKIADATKDRPISFKLDVMPIFMRSGCNQGSCHGAARGKDGFRLSLFGFDPDGDHYRLTREINGRRINLALPAESLLMEKAAGKVPHTGGQRIKEGDEYWNTLLRWLDAGAPQDPPTVATPITVELYPKNAVLDGKGSTQQMAVRARYSDGTDRDVTSLALFLSSNDNSAKISPNGLVTAAERGEAFVMARFSTFTVGAQMIVLPKSLQFTAPKVPENNYVDTLVNAKFAKLRIAPSELCDDETFLRRVHRHHRRAADRRGISALHEQQGPRQARDSWSMNFLAARSSPSCGFSNGRNCCKSARRIRSATRRCCSTTTGCKTRSPATCRSTSGWRNCSAPAAAPSKTRRRTTIRTRRTSSRCRRTSPRCSWVCASSVRSATITRSTAGRWTTTTASPLSSPRSAAKAPTIRETIVFNSRGGEVSHPVAKKVMPPKFLGGAVPDVAGKDRRVVLAQWLASPENPYFATNLANRVWAHFFGIGIVNEVDDVRVSNPASNPELLAELGKRFTGYKYDFKKLVRDICLSRTYQLATQANASNEGDTANFAAPVCGASRRRRSSTASTK